LGDINSLLKINLLIAYKWRQIVLAIRLWFKVDYCSIIMSYDIFVYYLIFR
jgi:hypothetical protein